MWLLSEKIDQSELSKIGKKALNLHYLIHAGVNVPDGFVLTSLEQIPNDQLLENFVKKIGGFPVVVRSSGAFEDLEGTSFAGQYESFLNIKDINDLKDKILNCFQSVLSERVIAYSKSKFINPEKLTLSVLVQRQVNAAISGVVFSVHPLSGKEEETLIEVCKGLGDKLVSGHITPTRLVLNNYSYECLTFQPGEDKLNLVSHLRNKVVKQSLQIQAFFGQPQDIEFCIDQYEELWIVQSRPITKIEWRNDCEEFSNADLKDGGISAEVCTPLMFSLYNKCFSSSMSSYLDRVRLPSQPVHAQWMLHRYGIAYWNTSYVKNALKVVPGFNEVEFDKSLGISKNYSHEGPIKTRVGFWSVVKGLNTLYHLNSEYHSCEKMIEDIFENFEHDFSLWKNKISEISKLDDKQFMSFFFDFIKYYVEFESKYFRVVYNNTNFQSDFQKFLRKLEDKHNLRIDFISLFSDLGDLSHKKLDEDIKYLVSLYDRNVSEQSEKFNSEFQKVLERNSHHCARELDITVPRWSENPKGFHEIFSQALKIENNEYVNPKIERKTFDPTLHFKERTLKQFNKMLKRSRQFMINREKVRDLSTRVYSLVRPVILELGLRLKRTKVISSDEKIFYYHIDELLAYAHENVRLPINDLIYYREILYHGFKKFVPPNEFGKRIVGSEKKAKVVNEGEVKFEGIACSRGIVSGRVKVLTSLEQQNKIENGDILIAKYTDPSWTPLFSRISAVATEVGGILSHAAVIGREYNIPVVLNVRNLTKNLQDGDQVTIDGDTGQVVLHSRI